MIMNKILGDGYSFLSFLYLWGMFIGKNVLWEILLLLLMFLVGIRKVYFWVKTVFLDEM